MNKFFKKKKYCEQQYSEYCVNIGSDILLFSDALSPICPHVEIFLNKPALKRRLNKTLLGLFREEWVMLASFMENMAKMA